MASWKRVIVESSSGTIAENTTGSAATLTTGRTLKVSLGSSSASTAFDGSANITDIGVGGTLAVGNGGTGQTTQQAAINALVGGAGSNNHVLLSDGTNVAMGALPAAAVPTLNQNTTGSAATLTTGRTLQVDLTSTSASTAFDGSANITDIGISGALGVTNGGTGLSSVAKGSLIHTTAANTFAALSGTASDNGKVVAYNSGTDLFELVDAGTATNANNVAVTVASDNEAKYITFVDGTSGNQAIEVNSALQFNPNTGTVTVNGNLNINGATNTIDVQTLTVEDATVLLSDGSSTAAGADGSGLIVSSTGTAANRADFIWKDTNLGVAGWQFKDDGAPASFPAMGVAALSKGAADPTSTVMPTGAMWYNDGTAGTKGLYLYLD